jgi:HK97 family phage portal protein
MGIGALCRGLFEKRGSVAIDKELFAFGNYLDKDAATGRFINAAETLSLSAVYRAVTLVADSIASLPVGIYKRSDDGEGKEKFRDHPLWSLLRHKPNPLQNAVEFRNTMMIHLLLKGNFYAQIIRNGVGDVVELMTLHPDRVTPKLIDMNKTVSIVYQVTLSSGQIVFPQDQIFHVRAMTTEGLKGLSPLDVGLRNFGTAIAAEEHTAAYFGRGVKPTGSLEHPGKLSAEAQENLKKSFEEKYAGTKNAYRLLILQEGMRYNTLSHSAEQAQLLQNKEFAVRDVCRWFGVPPHKLFAASSSLPSDQEQANQEYANDAVMPWLTRIEAAIKTQLLDPSEWDTIVIEFLMDAIARASLINRYNAHAVARNNGIMNIDEIRAKENMNPLPDGKGKVYLEPLNMVPAGTPRQQPDETEDDPNTTPGSPNPNLQQGRKSMRPLIQREVERALRREIELRARSNFDEARHNEYLIEVFAPFAESYELRTGKNKARALFTFAKDWLKRSEMDKAKAPYWLDERLKVEIDLLDELIG